MTRRDTPTPFFSIVLPTYQRAHLINRALESIRTQTIGDWELIIVDDGSRDNTFAAVEPFLLSDRRSRYHYAANRGLAGARNIGIAMANGAYITFLDSDDEYLPRHLEERKRLIESDPSIELLHGGVEVIGSDMVADKHDPTKLIPLAECVIGGTFVIQRALAERLHGFADIAYGDDSDFFDRAVKVGARIKRCSIPTYRYYRTESDSLCAITERGGLEAIREFRNPV